MIDKIGSIWRKWDLHIHTPKTKMANRFKIKNNSDDKKIWELYCARLNDYGASVVGVTDYFSVDNYDYLRENRKELGLSNDIVLFPNIELRVSDLKAGKSGNKVNLHIIFDNNLSSYEIKSFLSNLKVQNQDGRKVNFADDFDEIFDGTHLRYLPTVNDVLKALKDGLGDDYKEKIIIMVPNGEDGVTPNPRHDFGSNVDFMRNHVDIINSANPTDVTFYLKHAIDKLGRQYPCVSGCDAHDFISIENYPKQKTTWIKADTTFNGLKSITFEPELRVHIGETAPDLKSDSKVIKSLSIDHKDFGKQTLHFNPYLNTIIGGRSSGKSLLLSVLANKASGTNELKKNEQSNISYSKLITDYANNTEVILNNGSLVDEEMILSFIYQDGLQEIAFSDKKRNQFIKDIIGDNVKLNEHHTIFKNKRNLIQTKNTELENVSDQFEELNLEYSKLQKVDEIKGTIHQFEEQLKKIKNSLTSSELTEAKSIENYSNKAEEMVHKFRNQIEELERNLTIDFLVKNPNVQVVHYEMLNSKINKVVETENSNLHEYIKRVIERKKNKIELIKMAVIDKKNNQNYIKYIDDKKNNPIKEELNITLEQEKKKLKLKIDLEKKISQIQEKKLEIIEVLHEQLNIENLFRKEDVFNKDDVEIELNISINFQTLKETFQKFFNINYNEFKNIASGQLKEINTWDDEKNNKERDLEFINDYNQTIKNILNADKQKLELFQKKNTQLFEFIQYLSSFAFLNTDFNIIYRGNEFDRMSEGKKSFILLILILSQKGDQDPLLIDQPEDNLDNRAIYNDLIKYLRAQKKNRQIFIVTHNANVAIASDSENIIIANENDINEGNPDSVKFFYKSGSIENPEIEKDVCEILEGGTVAFKRRQIRYTI